MAAAKQLLANMDAEVRSTHANVAGMRGRLWKGAAPGSDLHRELEALGPERAAGLEEVLGARRRALLASAAAVPAAAPPLCDALAQLWGTTREATAERQLLSFSAASAASPIVRSHALLTQSTADRLSEAAAFWRQC